MNRFLVILIAIGLASIAWNALAFVLHLLFGAELPMIDQGAGGLGL